MRQGFKMHVNPVFIGNIDRQQEIAFNLVPKEWALRKLMYRNVVQQEKKKKKTNKKMEIYRQF